LRVALSDPLVETGQSLGCKSDVSQPKLPTLVDQLICPSWLCRLQSRLSAAVFVGMLHGG
jgi:hypothetical protein